MTIAHALAIQDLDQCTQPYKCQSHEQGSGIHKQKKRPQETIILRFHSRNDLLGGLDFELLGFCIFRVSVSIGER